MTKEELLQDYYERLNYGGIRETVVAWLKEGYTPLRISKITFLDFGNLFLKFYETIDFEKLDITNGDVRKVALKFIQDTARKKEFKNYLKESYGDISLQEYLGHFKKSNWLLNYWDWGQEMVNNEFNIYDSENFDKLWNGQLDIYFTENQLQRMVDSVNKQKGKNLLKIVNHKVIEIK